MFNIFATVSRFTKSGNMIFKIQIQTPQSLSSGVCTQTACRTKTNYRNYFWNVERRLAAGGRCIVFGYSF